MDNGLSHSRPTMFCRGTRISACMISHIACAKGRMSLSSSFDFCMYSFSSRFGTETSCQHTVRFVSLAAQAAQAGACLLLQPYVLLRVSDVSECRCLICAGSCSLAKIKWVV